MLQFLRKHGIENPDVVEHIAELVEKWLESDAIDAFKNKVKLSYSKDLKEAC